MIQNKNRNESPPISYSSPVETGNKSINNAGRSENFHDNYNERNTSPMKPIVKDDQIFNDRNVVSSNRVIETNMKNESKPGINETNSNNRDNLSPEISIKDNNNEKRFIDENNDKKEINLTKRQDDKFPMDYNNHTNEEPKSVIDYPNHDRKTDSPIKTDSENYRLSERKSDLELDYSGNSSENPSPLTGGFDSSNFESRSDNSAHDEQYMSNKFFIDDTKNTGANNYSDNNINLFALTPDQQSAFRELELRRQQNDFDDDYDYSLNYELDYDVREKLETLNAQLANEPSPPEPEHRNSRVAFKEELVSLVAPPDEYALSESEPEDINEKPVQSMHGDIQDDSEIINPPSPMTSNENSISPPKVETTHNESTSNSVPEPYDYEKKIHDPESDRESKTEHPKTYFTVETNSLSDSESDVSPYQEKNIDRNSKNDVDIVVSRGGKIHLMDQSEMVDSSGHIVNPEEEILDQNDDTNQTRPISAPAIKRNRNEVWSNDKLNSSSSSVKSDRNNGSRQSARPSSKYDVPKVDREQLQRQKEREEKRKKEQKEKEDMELKNKKEQNEKCYIAWLQKKNATFKEESDRRKNEEDEDKKQQEKNDEEKRKENLKKLKEIAKNKELQRHKEEKLRQYRIKEIEEGLVVHTESECKKAFKDWMKKKKEDLLMKQKEEKQKARITRLAMRQCRKSQNLAQAIHQANSFRYLDFYGYP